MVLIVDTWWTDQRFEGAYSQRFTVHTSFLNHQTLVQTSIRSGGQQP